MLLLLLSCVVRFNWMGPMYTIPKSPPPLYRFKIKHLEIAVYANSVIGILDHHNFMNDKRCKDLNEFEDYISDKLKTKEAEKAISIVNKVLNNKIFL